MDKPKYSELKNIFGDPGEFGVNQEATAKWEHDNMTQWRSDTFIGKNVPLLWPADAPFKNIYCNRVLVPVLDETFSKLIPRGLFNEIKSLDGCWCIRPIRGTIGKWSVHSYALALDFNAKEMPLGSESTWSDEFVATMKECGWTFGGDFSRKDPMHWELVDES